MSEIILKEKQLSFYNGNDLTVTGVDLKFTKVDDASGLKSIKCQISCDMNITEARYYKSKNKPVDDPEKNYIVQPGEVITDVDANMFNGLSDVTFSSDAGNVYMNIRIKTKLIKVNHGS